MIFGTKLRVDSKSVGMFGTRDPKDTLFSLI